jgi:hypothetical protein
MYQSQVSTAQNNADAAQATYDANVSKYGKFSPQATAAYSQLTDAKSEVLNNQDLLTSEQEAQQVLQSKYNRQYQTIQATAEVPTSSTTTDGMTQNTYGANATPVTTVTNNTVVDTNASNNTQTVVASDQTNAVATAVPVEVGGAIQATALPPNNTTVNADQDPTAVAQAFPVNGNAAGNEGPLEGGPAVTNATGQPPVGSTIATQVDQARQQTSAGSTGAKDWRFRISLAPGSNYLYNAQPPGILAPLISTGGVLFPYSPQINVTYTATYGNYDLTHTNYKIHTYKNSSVESISITADFTAQDTTEANYLLAVIHFFRSATKMFYGQDNNPSRGNPPPLVYLSGFGPYQFNQHPVVITNFTNTFPADVDYISAFPNNTTSVGNPGTSAIGVNNTASPAPGSFIGSLASSFVNNAVNRVLAPLSSLRQAASGIAPGGLPRPPAFSSSQNINQATRVPTKVQIQLVCLPIVTRDNISNQFSLQKYATGNLLLGSTNGKGSGGGIW